MNKRRRRRRRRPERPEEQNKQETRKRDAKLSKVRKANLSPPSTSWLSLRLWRWVAPSLGTRFMRVLRDLRGSLCLRGHIVGVPRNLLLCVRHVALPYRQAWLGAPWAARGLMSLRFHVFCQGGIVGACMAPCVRDHPGGAVLHL